MLKNTLARKLTSVPEEYPDRLTSLRLTLQGNQLAAIINVYAPTLMVDPATKEAFYSDWRSLLWRVDREDKVRSSWTPWSWLLQLQRAHAAGAVYRTGTDNHQLPVPAEGQIQVDLTTPTLQTLAPLGLRPRALKGPVRRATHQSHTQCWQQHRPQAGSDQCPTRYQACSEEKRGTGEEVYTNRLLARKTEF